MIRRPSAIGTIVRVNLKLLLATALCGLAWALWPTSPQWWGLGLVSAFLGIAAASELVEAARLIVKLCQRDRTLKDLEARGAQAKSSTLASRDALRKAGMIHD